MNWFGSLGALIHLHVYWQRQFYVLEWDSPSGQEIHLAHVDVFNAMVLLNYLSLHGPFKSNHAIEKAEWEPPTIVIVIS